MSAIRSLLDGLDPRVRFVGTTGVGLALVFVLWLVVFHDSGGAALGAAAAATMAGVGIRDHQVGTWLWRDPSDDEDPS